MIRYKRKRSRHPFFITVCLLVLLIFFSDRNPSSVQLPSQVFNVLISPINGAFYGLSHALQDAYDSIFGSKATQERVAELTQENAALVQKLKLMEQVVTQQEYLKNEYDLLQLASDRLIPATVTAKDPSDAFVRFTIDGGAMAGMQVGDVVVQGVKNSQGIAVEGLVGRITEVGLDYAKVTSIMDESGNISIMCSQSGDYGVIDGRDRESFHGYTMDANATAAVGDDIVTSGLGGVYPRGLYIGKLVDVHLSDDELTRRFSMEAPVDFTKLYRVLVLHREAKNE